jgi:hypothetical protein
MGCADTRKTPQTPQTHPDADVVEIREDLPPDLKHWHDLPL